MRGAPVIVYVLDAWRCLAGLDFTEDGQGAGLLVQAQLAPVSRGGRGAGAADGAGGHADRPAENRAQGAACLETGAVVSSHPMACGEDGWRVNTFQNMTNL